MFGWICIDTSGNTTWHMDDTFPVVRDFPIRDNLNKHGAVEIFEQ